MADKTVAELKTENKIQTSNNSGIWFATWYYSGSTLTPSISLSGYSEEFVVTKVSEILEKVKLEP